MTRLRTFGGLDLGWIANNEGHDETHVRAILKRFKLALEQDLGTTARTRDKTYDIIRLRDLNRNRFF